MTSNAAAYRYGRVLLPDPKWWTQSPRKYPKLALRYGVLLDEYSSKCGTSYYAGIVLDEGNRVLYCSRWLAQVHHAEEMALAYCQGFRRGKEEKT